MTFKQIQDRVMALTNGTSTTTRDRIKASINQRYLRMQSGINLEKLRRAVVDITLIAGEGAHATASVAKVFSIFDPTMRRVLVEATMHEIRMMDPGLDREGPPERYSVQSVSASAQVIYFWPLQTGNYTVKADVLTSGTELVGDNDVPTVPADFHDILVEGALAEEWAFYQKPSLEKKAELKFENRLSELRMFLVKSNTQPLTQGQWDDFIRSGRIWPWGLLP